MPQEEDLNENGFEPRTAKWNCFVALFTQKKLNVSHSKTKIFSIVVFSTNGLFLPPSSSTSAKKLFFAAFKVGRRTFKNVTVVISAKKRPAHNFLGDLLKHLSNFFKIAFLQFSFFSRRPGKNPKRPKSATHTHSHIHLLSFTLSLFQALTFYLSLLTNSLTLSPKNSHLLALPHSFTLSLPPAHTHSFSVQPSLSLLLQFI